MMDPHLPTMSVKDCPPTESIVVPDNKHSTLPPLDTHHRAVHKIRLSALSHNYSQVESAANRQRCSVIVVVKADGYGHGAIATALYLADSVGADAFAVATLEEAIALRKAFQESAQKTRGSVTTLFQNPSDEAAIPNTPSSTQMTGNGLRKRNLRPRHVRIIVLGPPVGFPRCFDDYYHHNIEVMISGPEVARALFEWVHNPAERKRTQVERAAAEAKQMALQVHHPAPALRSTPNTGLEHGDSNLSDGSTGDNTPSSNNDPPPPRYHPPSATLGAVTGSDLAKEVRAILKNQKLMTAEAKKQMTSKQGNATKSNGTSTLTTMDSTLPVEPSVADTPNQTPLANASVGGPHQHVLPTQTFAGIAEAAKNSRTRQKVIASEVFMETGEDGPDNAGGDGANTSTNSRSTTPTNSNRKISPPLGVPRKRLRWHALVDSGMGRLGFRTDPVSKEEHGKRQDSVAILNDMVDLEGRMDCPIEFFGMMTHMADANPTSTYTSSQISRFNSLLKRVRTAGISVPTISTDNSAALLTTTLTHFDPKELLTQEFIESRGFVRTGGAIYGQRPSFPQLESVSTLLASVRHVATLKKGESVGYDRAYQATRNVRIATLTVGFADGYPRELGNGIGKVAIRGNLFPVAGNVCMDMMMVELGDAEDKDSVGARVVVGDIATLWGPTDEDDGDGLVPLQEIAATLKTTQSALTCGLDKERVLRHYA